MFRKIVKLLLYFILLAALYTGTIHLLKIKVSIHEKNLQRINSQILIEYQTLSELSDNILSQIGKYIKDETVEATVISQSNLLQKLDLQFKLCVENKDYEAAVYLMNKKFSRFFEIINYSWEVVPNVNNDTALVSKLTSISEMELKIDSLINVAIREKKQHLAHLKILSILNPFKIATNRSTSNKIQKISVKVAPNIL